MQIGIVGLGRMEGNMARRLTRAGHEVVAFATAKDAVEPLAREGAARATSLAWEGAAGATSLDDFADTGVMQDSGEGRSAIMADIEEGVPADALSAPLCARFRSGQDHAFMEKALSAMRDKFGGHVEQPSGG
jgi:6-phosphogluconate dehydrogenase (decarboxylating)